MTGGDREVTLQKSRELLRLINLYGNACYAEAQDPDNDETVRKKAYKAVRNFMKSIGLEFEE
jgi:hypothetical protein